MMKYNNLNRTQVKKCTVQLKVTCNNIINTNEEEIVMKLLCKYPKTKKFIL